MMPEMHKWEVLDEATTRAKRMPVPGGWIYSLPNLPPTFVPDPTLVTDIGLQQMDFLRQIVQELNRIFNALQNRSKL